MCFTTQSDHKMTIQNFVIYNKHISQRSVMRSGFSRKLCPSVQDSWQCSTFEGQICSLRGAFTTSLERKPNMGSYLNPNQTIVQAGEVLARELTEKVGVEEAERIKRTLCLRL